jgi:hypothetical protein
MPDPLFEARLRARSYWYRDGLSEMVVGIVSLLQGSWILFNHLVNSKSLWYWPGALICLLLIAGFPVARIKAAIRERITYSRSGYVDDGESVRKRRIGVGIVLAILASVTGALALRYAAARGWAAGGVAIGALGLRVGAPGFATVSCAGRTLHHPRYCGQ